MDEQVLKVGSGRIAGVSNPNEQKGKMLSLFDGTTVICHLPLDESFPDRVVIIDDQEQILPGMRLDVPFTTELRVKTDGQDIDVIWH